MSVKIIEYNIRNDAILSQILKVINVIFYVFDFYQGMTCADDCNAQTQTDTAITTHKAISEIL